MDEQALEEMGFRVSPARDYVLKEILVWQLFYHPFKDEGFKVFDEELGVPLCLKHPVNLLEQVSIESNGQTVLDSLRNDLKTLVLSLQILLLKILGDYNFEDPLRFLDVGNV